MLTQLFLRTALLSCNCRQWGQRPNDGNSESRRHVLVLTAVDSLLLCSCRKTLPSMCSKSVCHGGVVERVTDVLCCLSVFSRWLMEAETPWIQRRWHSEDSHFSLFITFRMCVCLCVCKEVSEHWACVHPERYLRFQTIIYAFCLLFSKVPIISPAGH